VEVRRVLSLLVLVGALTVVGAAAAAPGSSLACGGSCDPGGGYTGCKTVSASNSASAWLIYSIRHVLVVSYCKRNGVITSISIAAHYCDSAGLVSCSPTAAWQTGGGVGSTWATFEAHAQWTVNTLHIYNNTDVVGLLVPTMDG
jgi:hypothetical protein